MTFTVGRVCKKIMGREAGRVCVIVSQSKGPFVLIDGDVKRRNCNRNHLEPLSATVNIKENASTKDVISALQNAGFEILGKKPKEKQTASIKPVKQRKALLKKKEEEPKKEKKKADTKPKDSKKESKK